MTDQRKGYLTDKSTNDELDQVYKNVNSFLKDKKISVNYTASTQDRNLSLMQPGITITLPALGDSGDGFELFVIDKSGGAAGSNQTILPNTGKLISGSANYIISTNYGFIRVKWDATEDAWFRTG